MYRLLTRKMLALAALAGIATAPGHASAQDNYPSRLVTVIVDRAPGGGTDVTARLMAQYLTKSLNQTFIVQNKAGAAGRIALQQVHDATPDGYTLEVVGSGYTVLPAIYKMKFNLLTDMTPIVMLSQGGLLLVANPKLGVKSVSEFVALAKKSPGKISSATVGRGSISDLCTALFASMAGVKLNNVQYKGADPAMVDTIAGTTDILFSSPQNAIPQVKAGALTALATTAKFPMPGFAEAPSIDKSGVPGFEVVEWYGVIGPKNLPAAVVEKINTAVNDMLKDPAIIKRIEADGFVPAGGTAAHFQDVIGTLIDRWTKLTTDMGIQQQ